MSLPDFNSAQLERLRGLGICDDQVKQLRFALIENLILLSQHTPAVSAVRDALVEIEDLSRELSRKLRALVASQDVAYRAVHGMIEKGYWPHFPDDNGPTCAHVLSPRLDMLEKAAAEAIQQLPSQQTRHRAADWRPVRTINLALQCGWLAANVGPYPRNLSPSLSEASAFKEICEICYAASGYEGRNLERPIKAYLKEVKTPSEMQGV